MQKSSRSSWPVFVIGCHRSGTTLLRYLLDSHENVACPPESKFLSALQLFVDYPQVGPALLSWGLTRPQVYEKLRVFINSMFMDYALKRGKHRWADKTPNYFRILPFIDEVFLENVLYIVIVRHPLDCIDSINSYFHISNSHEDPEIARIARIYGKGKYGCAKFWTEVYEHIRTFTASCSERVHVVTYEELTQTPTNVMESVFRFIDEPPSDVVSRVFEEQHDQGFGDKNILKLTNIYRSRIGKWKKWPLLEQTALWNLVAKSAEQYGYSNSATLPALMSAKEELDSVQSKAL